MQKTSRTLTIVIAVVLSFVLGFLSFIGLLAGGIYFAASQLSYDRLNEWGFIDPAIDDKVNEILNDEDADISLKAMTLMSLYQEYLELTKIEQVSLDFLFDRYGVASEHEYLNWIPTEVSSLPLDELLGDRGLTLLLENVTVETVLRFVPEDVVAGILSEPLIESLKDKNLAAIVEGDFEYILEGVRLGYLLGVSYELNENGEYEVIYGDPNSPTFLEMLAPLDLSAVLSSVLYGESDIIGVISENLGDVIIYDLIKSVAGEIPFGDIIDGKTFADVIIFDEEIGGYAIDIAILLADAKLGKLLGYEYNSDDEKWYDESGNIATGVFAAFADIGVIDLLEPKDEQGNEITIVELIVGDLQLGELLGAYLDENGEWRIDDGDPETEDEKAEGMFAALYGLDLSAVINPEPGSDITDTLADAFKESDTTLGKLMGYQCDENGIWREDDGDPTTVDEEVAPLFKAFCGISIADLISPEEGKTAADIVMDSFEDADTMLGDLMGYYCDENGVWRVDDGDPTTLDEEADALFGALCGVSLSQLISPEPGESASDVVMDAFETAGTMLGDIMGYYCDENGVWRVDDGDPTTLDEEADALFGALCGVSLSQLISPEPGESASDVVMDAFETAGTMLGDIMGYYCDENGVWRVDDGDPTTLDEEADALFGALCGVKIYELMNPEVGESASDVVMDAFETAGTMLGDIMGYYCDENGVWRVDDGDPTTLDEEADALFGALCGVKIYELMNPEVGESASDVVMDAFENAGTMLGDIMGYYCDENGVWRVDDGDPTTLDEEADALFGALCGVKLYELMNPEVGESASDVVMDAFETAGTMLGDIMGYYCDENGVWRVDDGDPTTLDEEADALFGALCGVKLYELMNPPAGETASDIVMDAFESSRTMLGDIMGYTKVLNPEYDPTLAENDENYDVPEFLWYDSDGNEIKGLGAIISKYTLTDVMDGGLNAEDIMSDLTLADVYELTEKDLPVYINGDLNNRIDDIDLTIWVDKNGVPADKLINSIAGLSVDSLDTEISNLCIGQVVGIIEYNDEFYSWSVSSDNTYVVLTKDSSITAEFSDLSLNSLSNGGLEDRVQTIQIGKFMGYTEGDGGKWYDENGDLVTGIMGTLAGSTADSINDDINTLKIGELMGYTEGEGGKWYDENGDLVTGIMGTLAGSTADSINDDINTLKIGELMGYTEGEGGKWYDENDDLVTGIMGTLAGSTADSINEDINTLKIGELMGYTEGDGGKWYDENGDLVTGIMGTLAGSTADSINEDINTLKIGELMGYTEGEGGKWYDENDDLVTGIMGTLAGSTADSINEDINTLRIGQLMGYIEGNDGKWYDEDGNEVTGITGALAGSTANTIDSDIENISIGELMGYVEKNGEWYEKINNPDGTVTEKKVTGMMAALADSTASSIKTDIEGLTIGELMGYTQSSNGDWFDQSGNEVTGIMAAIAGSTASGLQSDIEDLTIGQLMGYVELDDGWYEKYVDSNGNVDYNKVTGIMAAIAGSTASNLKTDIQNLTVGELMGYTKKSNGKWYDSNDNEVTGIMGAIAGSTATNLQADIENLSIGQLMGYTKKDDGKWYDTSDTEVTGIMGAIVDSNASNIETKIKGSVMGELLGYYKGDNLKDSSDNVIADQWQWYSDSNKTVKVHVLMNKVANTKFDSLGNLTNNLTIADLVSEGDRTSGFLSLIPSDTTLENLPTAATNAFNNSTLYQLKTAGIISVDDSVLNEKVIGRDISLGEMKLAEFINYALTILSI